MPVPPHDGRIDGLHLVGRQPKRSRFLVDRVPNLKLDRASEAREGLNSNCRIDGMSRHGRAGAQNLEDAVDRYALCSQRRGRARPIGQKGSEKCHSA